MTDLNVTFAEEIIRVYLDDDAAEAKRQAVIAEGHANAALLNANTAGAYAASMTASVVSAANSAAGALADRVTAGTSAASALASSTSALAYKNSAAASAGIATAAATASGARYAYYETKAVALGDLASIPADALIEVWADESQSGQRVVYKKVSGALVPKFVFAGSVVNGGAVFGVSDFNALPLAIRAAPGSGLGVDNKLRAGFYADAGFFSQAYAVFSGIFRPDTPGDIVDVVPPGAYPNIPHNRYFANDAIGGAGGMVGLSNDIIGPNLLCQDNGLGGDAVLNASDPRVANPGTGYVQGEILAVSGGTLFPETWEYSPPAASSVFKPDFAVDSAAHVVLTRKRAGVTVTLLQGTEYNVTGVGDDTGVILTLGLGSQAGDIYTATGTVSARDNIRAWFGYVLEGGTNYSPGEVFPLQGGDPLTPADRIQVRVLTTGAGGKITSYEVVSIGQHRRWPTQSVETSPYTAAMGAGGYAGAGTGARFFVHWSVRGPVRLYAKRVDGGQLREVGIVNPGYYSQAPGVGAAQTAATSTVAITGGTGTGATLTIDWVGRTARSRQEEYLNSSGNIVASLEGGQNATWLWSYNGLANHRGDHAASHLDFGPVSPEAVGSRGRLFTRKGFSAPVGSVMAMGHARGWSLERTVSASLNDTVDLGRFKVAGGGAILTISANETSARSVRRWTVPLIWQADSDAEGGTDAGANWLRVPAEIDRNQSGEALRIALDAQYSSATGDVALRLRTEVAGTARSFSVQIDATVSSAGENALGLSYDPALRRFEPSTATAAAVTAPTRILMVKEEEAIDRPATLFTSPVSGTTVTIPEGTTTCVIGGAATIAALTVALPANPVKDQVVTVDLMRAVTALTFTATGPSINHGTATNGGTVAAATEVRFRYNFAAFQWWRV